MLARMTTRLAASLVLLVTFGCTSAWTEARPANPADPSRNGAHRQPDDDEFGAALDVDEKAIVDRLTPSQVSAIDAAILQGVPATWCKVAMVLGKQLKARPGLPTDVPLEFYWQRLSRLVERGDLESQGNLRRARFSEVRRR